MNLTELIPIIFQVCIIPLLGVLTTYLVKYINMKSNAIANSVNNATATKYINMINETITNCVIATNQTYVEALKTQGKFDAEAQKEAFQKTFQAVLLVLSDDAKDYIKETTGDLNSYLTQLIEAQVNKNKPPKNIE